MNSVQLVGNIANDPELRTTSNGNMVCSFRIACQRRYKNANNEYDADFFSCVAWRQTAEFIHKHFIKGNKIGLTGSLQSRSYDAQDGSKRYVTEVVVDNAEFVAPRSDGQYSAPPPASAPAYQPQAQQPYNEQMHMGQIPSSGDVDDDDELPF